MTSADIGLNNNQQKKPAGFVMKSRDHRQIAKEMDEIDEIEKRLTKDNIKSSNEKEVFNGLDDRLKEVKAQQHILKVNSQKVLGIEPEFFEARDICNSLHEKTGSRRLYDNYDESWTR